MSGVSKTDKIRRIFLLIGLVFSTLMLASTSGLIDSVFWLLFAGVVPGTDYIVPATVMLVIYILLAVLLVKWIIRKELHPASPSLKKAQREANKEAARILDRKIIAEYRKEARLAGPDPIESTRNRYSHQVKHS